MPVTHQPSRDLGRAPAAQPNPPGTRPAASGTQRFGALRSPAYRRYLIAATITSASSWTFMTGLGWAMLDATGSAAVVTAVQTAMILPIPFAAIPAGLIVDRHGPRVIVVATLVGLAAMSAVLAGLAAADSLTLLAVIPVALVFGAFDGLYVVPAQVLVGRSVDRSLMASAIALSALPLGIGRITGGPLGGFLLENGGATAAMTAGAVGLALAALVLVGLGRLEGLETEPGTMSGLRDGLASARRSPGAAVVIRSALPLPGSSTRTCRCSRSWHATSSMPARPSSAGSPRRVASAGSWRCLLPGRLGIASGVDGWRSRSSSSRGSPSSCSVQRSASR